MLLNIVHTTRYKFDTPVSYGLQQIRQTPQSGYGQTVLNWKTTISGGHKELQYSDHFDNLVELIQFEGNVEALEIQSEGSVEVAPKNGVIGAHTGRTPLWFFKTATALTKPGGGIKALVQKSKGDSQLGQLHKLSDLIGDTVAYETGSSTSESTAETAIREGKGVCQDHAHIFVAAAREMGHPARYVSGYLMMDDRIDQDATHAWAEAHVDGLGWVGFDVSNAICPDERYVRVATGLDYTGAAPVTGTTFGGSGESLSVDIAVSQQ